MNNEHNAEINNANALIDIREINNNPLPSITMSLDNDDDDDDNNTNKETKNECYQEPSPLLKRLFLPEKTPSLSLSSDQQWLLFAGEPALPSINVLAKPEEKLAGIRFDPSLFAPSRLDYAFSLKAQHMKTSEVQQIPLPENSEGIRYLRFNPSPPLYATQQFVFASKVKNQNTFQVFLCNLVGAKWEFQPITSLQHKRLNFVNGCAYQFTSDGKYLLCKVMPENHPPNPPVEPISVGPSIQTVEQGARKAPGRTYQDLLKNVHDKDKLRYFLTTELVKVDLSTTTMEAEIVPQSKSGKLITHCQSSPSGRYLLVTEITKFSYAVPLNRFGKTIQLWDLESAAILHVVVNPVDDEIPLSYDACSRHKRRFEFHPCHPHVLLYAHAVDGGDPKKDPVDGERDALYTQHITEQSLGEPVKLCGLEWRYDDIAFTQDGLALVDEYRWNDRMERKWRLNSENKALVWERSWEDRYASPGVPFQRLGPNGQRFVVTPQTGKIFLKGAGASPLGDRPFLDLMNLETLQKERLWRCKPPKEGGIPDVSLEVGGKLPTVRENVYESIVTIMHDNDTVLVSCESKTSPRNYFVASLTKEQRIQVTDFPHPQPDLLGVQKELVRYKRKDGVELTANLYTPANYDGKSPRPTLFWAYPREFKNSKAAGQVKGSKHKFVSASWASPIHWAAKGWIIMDDFSLPIVGEGDEQPNDTFVEQVVAGATAAVEYVVERGVCDPTKCAVGGHSYGSFMTAHLLSHTGLFAAGIGRSGAFNRTLTPMSFQSEDRSLWEARDVYIEMSPLVHVQKYSEQQRVGKLLLIHGQVDENSGTHPLQSERYFAALKAFGIESRLCMLPHERHSYKARESILHMAWEQEEWLKSLE